MAAMRLSSRMHKKGMFLTFISIAIIAGIIIIFNPTSVDLKKDTSSLKSRISNVNSYVFDLENVYLERALQASGRRAIISLIGYMEAKTEAANEERFLSDFGLNFEGAFSEAMVEGSVNGEPLALMAGQTFPELVDDITAAARSAFNVNTEFSGLDVNDVTVHQSSPWFVNVDFQVSFMVTTAEGTASWQRSAAISTAISIENFEDPYYLVKTLGKYSNKIKKSSVGFNEWDVNKVKGFITDGAYTHFQDGQAPGFISRFVNDVTPSQCCGIESIVDPNMLQSLGLASDKDASYSDYLFWSTAENCDNPAFSLYKVNSIDADFPNLKFDLGHLSKYRLSADEQLCPPQI